MILMRVEQKLQIHNHALPPKLVLNWELDGVYHHSAYDRSCLDSL